jgi:phenylpropionate dioxygenase-like ring-hydroxylating dioxygenase large terminal subunit
VTTREQNEFLTQTGRGTPMGELFRRYWLPALLAEELPEPDCPPVRVTLLSERLLAFRDSSGKLGLIDEFCAHRGVSLWFGRNEQDGLRCPYHGWKYDVTGQCVEVPSEPVESGYAEKIKLAAYPLVERGGVLWTYMGSPELQPALPEFEFAMVGPTQRFVSKRFQETNFLQALEGGIDPCHVSFLHSAALSQDPLIGNAKGAKYNRPEARVKLQVEKSDGGLVFAYSRNAEQGDSYWRVMQWVMPTFTLIPPHADHPIHGHFWIPIDDEHCWVWTYDYHPLRELTEKELKAMKDGFGLHVKLVPGTYCPVANKDNDYLMDRAAQKTGALYSGIESIGMQDASLQESMGHIQDRTRENLVTSDNFILVTRQRLRDAARSLQKGVPPPGLSPESHHVRSATLVLPDGVAPLDAVKDLLKVREGVAPATA